MRKSFLALPGALALASWFTLAGCRFPVYSVAEESSPGQGGSAGQGAMSGTGGSAGGGSSGSAGEAAAGGSGSGTVALYDDFEDGAAPDWFVVAGNFAVVDHGGNRLYRQSELSPQLFFASSGDLAWRDVALEAKVNVLAFGGSTSSELVGLYARFVSATSHYYVGLRADGKFTIRKRFGGTNVALGTPVQLNLTTGTDYTIRFELVGTRLRAYLNGVLQIEANDAEIESGRIAVGSNNATADFDDVRVTLL